MDLSSRKIYTAHKNTHSTSVNKTSTAIHTVQMVMTKMRAERRSSTRYYMVLTRYSYKTRTMIIIVRAQEKTQIFSEYGGERVVNVEIPVNFSVLCCWLVGVSDDRQEKYEAEIERASLVNCGRHKSTIIA